MDTSQACVNTDRELYREPDQGGGSYYSDSIHVTESGGIGMNCGGHVIVMPIRTWHALAKAHLKTLESPYVTNPAAHHNA